MRSRSIVVPLTLSVAVVTLLATGCYEQCDTSAEANPEIVFTGGYDTTCFYSSSVPPDGGIDYSAGELLFFPGGMHYALEHHLPCAPWPVEIYLSFGEYGTHDGGNVAPAVGNQSLLLGVDETAIHVANDSCADYWLLVTTSCPSCP
jgi:hypothetical protein